MTTIEKKRIQEERRRQRRVGIATVVACLIMGIICTIACFWMFATAPRTDELKLFLYAGGVIIGLIDVLFMSDVLARVTILRRRRR